MNTSLSLLYVAAEVHPLIKTGGLADVSGALPSSLWQLSVDARLLLPAYPRVIDRIKGRPVTEPFTVLSEADKVRLFLGALPGGTTPVYAIDCASLYDRDGGPYLDIHGHDWPDNALRFGVLAKVAAMFGSGSGLAGWAPDIIHCNDWQAGLAPAYLAHNAGIRACSIFGIHNMAFQGNFPPEFMPALELPESSFQADGLEFHGHLSFLKAGLYYADHLVTVSPTYAKELLTAEYGFGLQDLLAQRCDRLTGVLNGIDTIQWDPLTDPHLPAHYGPGDLAGKAANKRALQERLSLEQDSEVFLLGMVTRLTYQKGVDLVLGITEELLEEPVQMVILGSGSKRYEAEWRSLVKRYPRRLAVTIGFDESLAHLVEAGGDGFLIPSRFEPCGLNQMYSMRYGTLPIVRRTGGLADTVVDVRPSTLTNGTATGFMFEQATESELLTCVLRALLVHKDKPVWRSIQDNAMQKDFSWNASAARYKELYQTIVSSLPDP